MGKVLQEKKSLVRWQSRSKSLYTYEEVRGLKDRVFWGWVRQRRDFFPMMLTIFS